jgi:hypothetical protein
MFRIYSRDANHGLPGWAPMIPASRDGQKKSKTLTSLLAEFLFLLAPFARRMQLCLRLSVLISVISG